MTDCHMSDPCLIVMVMIIDGLSITVTMIHKPTIKL